VVKNTFYAAGDKGPGFDAKFSYVYGGCAGAHTNTEAEYAIENAIYGGTFTGFWGVGGGSTTKMNGNVKTTVYGGTFNGYDAGPLRNAISGATRNGSMNGDVVLEILGGEMNGYVVGGVIYGSDSSAADVLDGNVSVTIKGGTFDGDICGVAKPGWNVTLAEGKTCTVIGEQVAGTALRLNGAAVFDSFTANGETIEIGANTDIEIKALNGAVSFKQTEGWQAHDYIKLPAGSAYSINDAGSYGSYTEDATILVTGNAVTPVGAILRLSDRIGVRIVLNPDDVNSYGDVFTYSVKLGDKVLAEGTYADIVANNYSVLFDGIGLAQFGEKFTVSSPLLKDLEYSIVDLATLAQTAWADNAKWKAYADAVIEFHNVYNLNAQNTLEPEAVALVPSALKGELGDKITNADLTLLMSDAAGIRLTMELSEAPEAVKVVIGEHTFDATVEGNTVSADVFFAHEAMADAFEVSVQDAEGKVYMTCSGSLESIANALANDDANENKDNAKAFLVYMQKAVACK